MNKPRRIKAIHPGGKCPALEKYIEEKHNSCEVERFGDFRFKPGFLFALRKKLNQKHDATLIYVKPPFNYFKKLLLWLFLLFVPSKEKLILTDDGDRVIPIRWIDGFSLLLLFLPAVILTLLIQGGAFVYVFFAGIYLRTPGKLRKCNGDNKKLAFLVPSLQLLDKFKGSTSHIRGVTGAFRKLGWETVIFSAGEMQGVEGKYHIIPPVLRDLLTGGVVDMLYDFVYTFRALPLIKKENPAFLYQRHGRYCIGGVMLSRMTGIPLVLEMNAMLGWESGRWSSTGNMMRKYIAFYEKLCIIHAARISAISILLKNDIVKAGAKEEDVFVNPNGADADAFKPGSGGEEVRKFLGIKNEVVAGFCGSFYPWHGIDVLTEVVKKITPLYENVVFLLIGDGPEKTVMEDRLEKMGIMDNCRDRIIFTGRIPPEKVPAYLDACDILLSPIGSGKEYSSPIKIFEYMAAGKAILCFDTGQMSDVLENGRDAILTLVDNAEKFIGALEELVKDKTLRENLGANARSKAVAGFTWEANAKRVMGSIVEEGADSVGG